MAKFTIHNLKLFLKYGKNIPFKFSSGNFPFVLGAFAQLVTNGNESSRRNYWKIFIF